MPTVQELLDSPLANFITLVAKDYGFTSTSEDLIVNCVHPLFLKAKVAVSAEDNPTWKQAFEGAFAEEYWQAVILEIETLKKMEAWEIVEQIDDMNVIGSTWAFKLKRYPDGLIKKFKARFCQPAVGRN